MTEPFSAPLSAFDHGPFAAFVVRRLLRALATAILVVLLAGVVIINDASYQQQLRAQERVACLAQAPEFNFEDYSPASRFC